MGIKGDNLLFWICNCETNIASVFSWLDYCLYYIAILKRPIPQHALNMITIQIKTDDAYLVTHFLHRHGGHSCSQPTFAKGSSQEAC
ncbi:hypothetical protein ACU10_09930 [Xanthomonas oryzae pv. oryzicola]|nr:hypothetical protein ACU13_09985 [Xanthomonas oryzae pv. oryzicola]AKN97038.1 hypothetical protein ACU10_09930 [Xanthomonas oryzae pv. oryzicola]AKO16000.1 hypothetical protein ACU12_09970 [Xanthomonas oryzae pv. oryzicola]